MRAPRQQQNGDRRCHQDLFGAEGWQPLQQCEGSIAAVADNVALRRGCRRGCANEQPADCSARQTLHPCIVARCPDGFFRCRLERRAHGAQLRLHKRCPTPRGTGSQPCLQDGLLSI